MDEINAGDYDQLTYEQIREFYPIEYKKRAEDKLGYRYPNGESYIDLSLRVNESLKKLDFMTKENVNDNRNYFIHSRGHISWVIFLGSHFWGHISGVTLLGSYF